MSAQILSPSVPYAKPRAFWGPFLLALTGLAIGLVTIGSLRDGGDGQRRAMHRLRHGLLQEAVRDRQMGMIRPTSRWTDHDRVSYRWWEADTVVVAAVADSLWSSGELRAGDRCGVHGSTLVTFVAMFDDDVVAEVGSPLDRRERPLERDDCPLGTSFIMNQAEAGRMRLNFELYLLQLRHDRHLLEIAKDATGRFYNSPPDR